MIAAKKLLKIDQLLNLPRIVFEWIYFIVRSGKAKQYDQGKVLVIKLMGIGSIIKLTSLLDEQSKDKDDIVLCTFDTNRELANLMGFNNQMLIRTNTLYTFLSDIFKIFGCIKKHSPRLILDFERRSNAVSLLRMWLSLFSGSNSISFGMKDKQTKRDKIYLISQFNHEQFLLRGITYINSKSTVERDRLIIPDPNKIIININASDYVLARRYSREGFISIIKWLTNYDPDFQIYLTGVAAEYDYVYEVQQKHALTGVHNMAGKWNLEQLTHNLADCRLFITNDSGPMHLAAYLKIPTIVIWGPTSYQYFGYDQVNNMHNISLEMDCAPCFTNPKSKVARSCKGKISCMQLLPSKKITGVAKNLLEEDSDYRKVMVPDGALSTIKSQKRLLEVV